MFSSDGKQTLCRHCASVCVCVCVCVLREASFYKLYQVVRCLCGKIIKGNTKKIAQGHVGIAVVEIDTHTRTHTHAGVCVHTSIVWLHLVY